MQNKERKLYAMQYHEKYCTLNMVKKCFTTSCTEVCGFAGYMDNGELCKTAIEEIRNTVGDGKVLLALSGGVDSSVAAALIS